MLYDVFVRLPITLVWLPYCYKRHSNWGRWRWWVWKGILGNLIGTCASCTHPIEPIYAINIILTSWALTIQIRFSFFSRFYTAYYPYYQLHPRTSFSLKFNSWSLFSTGSDHNMSQKSPNLGGSRKRSTSMMSWVLFISGERPPCRHKNFPLISAANGRLSNESIKTS